MRICLSGSIIPLRSGASGRLVSVLLRGEAGDLVVGKELEIRRVLSRSHLFSSAFIVEPEGDDGGAPDAFRFRGAGWGHGVGLCERCALARPIRIPISRAAGGTVTTRTSSRDGRDCHDS